MTSSPFTRLGLPASPWLLAPLAGVSDHPFRRVCTALGADLTYVEMLSAAALIYESQRTYDMMRRHPAEALLGVQVTGRNPDEFAKAVEILGKHANAYETIDLNFGCPVQKVVKNGCGSALLRDPETAYQVIRAAVQATDKPLSVKIRLGWDRTSMTAFEVAEAAERAGAAWLTVHGRFRSDDYSVPVDLERIAQIKRRVRIPVVGNGNLFSRADALHMQAVTGVDGVMMSRGALGNPWIFRELRTGEARVTLDEWLDVVLTHLRYQAEQYGDEGYSAICMRKHLLWYAKGWLGAKRLREQLSHVDSIAQARTALGEFAADVAAQGQTERFAVTQDSPEARFVWDPKYEMDRRLDRGVGDDQLA